uniref:Uncharacterized protein n=1 Tax=Rhizophora mucronata TaxID=61149 RepID=A0A2P2R4H0_RHIMU
MSRSERKDLMQRFKLELEHT